MALMSASSPSESCLILAEVNGEICDRKIQSVFLFLCTERATWHFAMKTRQCGSDINPLVVEHKYTWVIPAMQCILSYNFF